MKQYQFKLYSKALVYKATINPSTIMTEVNFTNTINGGQGNMKLGIQTDFDDTTYSLSDVVRVYVYDDNNDGTLIYSGFISKINRIQNTNGQYIELELIGLAGLLAGYHVVGTRNEDPADSLRDLIDGFNTNFGATIFSYDVTSVVDYGVVTNIDLVHTDCLSAIKKIAGLTNYYWYIGADGKLFFNPKPSTVSHYFTNQKDVESITVEENMEEVVNKLYVARSYGPNGTYTDATSISTYGVKERYDNKTGEILDLATMNEYGNNTILTNKDLKKQTKVVLNSKYDIESVLPGQTFKIRNFAYSIDGLQVVQTSYKKNNLTISVEKYSSLGEIVVG